MGKKLFIFTTVLLISALAVGWYFFSKESRYLGTSSLKAISVETPFFLRIRNFSEFSAKAFKSKGWNTLSSIPGSKKLCQTLQLIDSLLKDKKVDATPFLHKELVYFPTKQSGIFLLELGSISEKSKINDLIGSFLRLKNGKIKQIELDKVSVLQYQWIDNNRPYSLYTAFYKGILLAGSVLPDVQAAVDQIDLPSILDDSDYLRINKTATENIDLNLFINHKSFDKALSTILNDSLLREMKADSYAKWTEMDILLKENQVLLNGFSVTDSLNTCFLDVFNHQIAKIVSLDQLLPSTIVYYKALNLSNPGKYFEDYHQYIQRRGRLDYLQDSLQQLSARIGLDVKNFLLENWSGEAALAYGTINLENSLDDRFLLLKFRKGKILPLVNSLLNSTSERNSRTKQSFVFGQVFPMPVHNFGELIFGPLFGTIRTNYFLAGEEFLLMGSNPGALARYARQLADHEVLDDCPAYKNYKTIAASGANFQVWLSPERCLPFFEGVLSDNLFDFLSDSQSGTHFPSNMGWQFSADKGNIYNTANILYDNGLPTKVEPYWSYKHFVKLTNKPGFVTFSARNNSKLILFTDEEFNLVALDREGFLQWKRKLDGNILGAVKVIENGKSGEFQLVLNTKNSIYKIDGNGRLASGFPVRLKARATNSISVFDYEKNRDYRFLIACADHRIYNFDKMGKPLKGWQSPKLSGIAEDPIVHYRIGGKDFIVIKDKNSSWVLDRQGKDRSKNAPDFSKYSPEINYGSPTEEAIGLFTTKSSVINRMEYTQEGYIYLFQSKANEH